MMISSTLPELWKYVKKRAIILSILCSMMGMATLNGCLLMISHRHRTFHSPVASTLPSCGLKSQRKLRRSDDGSQDDGNVTMDSAPDDAPVVSNSAKFNKPKKGWSFCVYVL